MLREPFMRGLAIGIVIGSAATVLFAFAGGLTPPAPGAADISTMSLHLHYGSGG